jgi:hypothetical protein
MIKHQLMKAFETLSEELKRAALASAPFSPSLLSRKGLKYLRREALRSKAWFKLEQVERAVVELTIKVVERVRNATLAGIILRIVEKLRRWMKPSLKELAVFIGRPLAEKAARIAEAWGNHEAKKWLKDPGFIIYLGISWLNTPKAFRH